MIIQKYLLNFGNEDEGESGRCISENKNWN